jgi:hypothetical protein
MLGESACTQCVQRMSGTCDLLVRISFANTCEHMRTGSAGRPPGGVPAHRLTLPWLWDMVALCQNL